LLNPGRQTKTDLSQIAEVKKRKHMEELEPTAEGSRNAKRTKSILPL